MPANKRKREDLRRSANADGQTKLSLRNKNQVFQKWKSKLY